MSQSDKIKVEEVFPCDIGGDGGVCIYPSSKFGCCGLNDAGEQRGCDRAVNHLRRRMNDRGDRVTHTLYVHVDNHKVSLLRDDERGFFIEKGWCQEIL